MSVAHPALAACAFAALSTCACGFPFVCTAVGCMNGAHVKVNRAFSEREAADLEVTACWQAVCASGRPLLPAAGQGSGRTTYLRAPGLAVPTTLWVRSGGYDLTLDIEVLRELGAPYSMRDGDVYEVKVTGPGGVMLLEGRKPAQYSESYPNGQRCDQDPCRETSLQIP